MPYEQGQRVDVEYATTQFLALSRDEQIADLRRTYITINNLMDLYEPYEDPDTAEGFLQEVITADRPPGYHQDAALPRRLFELLTSRGRYYRLCRKRDKQYEKTLILRVRQRILTDKLAALDA